MNLSLERIEALAARHGFPPETLEKVVRLGELMANISRHPLLSKVLVLKGGTALNLFFGPPPRLSVDLDFNYIGHLDRDQMLAQRPEVERAVELIARAQKYEVQRRADAHAGGKTFLNYRATTGSRARIEVDLNFLYRQPVLAPKTLSMWQPGDLPPPSASVIGVEELVAGKLIALLDRGAPRDLFDAGRLPDLFGKRWLSKRQRSVFVALAAVLPHPLHAYGRPQLERATDSSVREQLWPMLNQGQQPTAKALREAAWETVSPLLNLSAAEREYCERVQHGELVPELLFPRNAELAERMRQHPALRWKAENARGRSKRLVRS